MALVIKRAELAQELEGAHALRLQVFAQEQGIPRELDLDGLDAALHAVALQDRVVIETGRLVMEPPTHGIIGRMAVARPLLLAPVRC